MTTRSKLVAAVLALAGVWTLGSVVARQDRLRPPVTKVAPATTGPTHVYYGAAACSNKGCHGGEPPRFWIVGKELISRCIESDIWAAHDKHAQAWRVLSGARGQRMAKILGYDVTKAKACLTCHATWIDDKSVLKASIANHFNLVEGVTCVVCHGAYEDWVGAHSVLVNASKFRALTPQQKEKQYGMTNLRDPVRQAELCVSCHIGNAEQGKFVTHEMYAAGHPPLPGFEAVAFAEQQPRHWQYLAEKSPALQRELGLRPGELERTQLVLVGALINFRDSVRLLARNAATACKATDPDMKALDLANFDCWSCHHGIRSPSWRQERGYKGTPGRVPWRSWSSEMMPVVIDHLADADPRLDRAAMLKHYDSGMERLHAGFNARTYGDAAQVEKAAAELAAFAESLVPRARAVMTNSDTARATLARLTARFSASVGDVDAARVASWSFGSIHDELHGARGGNPRIRGVQSKLDKELKLRLPASIEAEMDQSLDAIKYFQPKTIKALFGELGAALKR